MEALLLPTHSLYVEKPIDSCSQRRPMPILTKLPFRKEKLLQTCNLLFLITDTAIVQNADSLVDVLI